MTCRNTFLMHIWERLIADTAQLGGVLVFIEDQTPANFKEWLAPLQSQYSIPFVVRSANDLLARRFVTRSQDLVVLLENQKDFFSSLNSVLQGQRLFLGAEDDSQNIDFFWANASAQDWAQAIQGAVQSMSAVKSLHENLRTQEAGCLFLDRDDVVVRNVPYNNDPAKVELLPGAVDLIQRAHKAGMWVALVTNQSGLGRGRISWLEYKAVHQKMLSLLAEQGCWIDECVWASFIENEAVVEGRLLAGLRKPRAGMFQLVHEKLRVKMDESFMVGDSATDLIAAHAAGVKKLYLFHSEKFAKEEATLRQYQNSQPTLHFQVLQKFADLKI